MKKIFFLICLSMVFVKVYGQSIDRVDELSARIATYTDSIPALKEKVDISVSNTPLKEFLRAVAEMHNLNLSLDNIQDFKITNNFENVTIEELLVFICSSYSLDVKILSNIIIVYPLDTPKNIAFAYDQEKDLLSFHFTSDTLKHIAKEITDSTHYNLILSRDSRNMIVHGFIEDLPFDEAMNQFAASNDLEIEKKPNDIYYISLPLIEVVEEASGGNQNQASNSSSSSRRRTSRRRTSSSRNSGGNNQSQSFSFENSKLDPNRMNVDASGTSVKEAILQVSRDKNIGYFFLDEPTGELECHLLNVTYEEFLDVALASADPQFSFTKRNEVYIMGDPKNLGIYESYVYAFKNRSVEKIGESIPQAMSTDVDIIEYPELNSLILTGSKQKVDKLIGFLSQIDKPVANVLIEVMVVVINRGSSLETGITAGITDSIPTTQGEIFTGLDMTLNSGSINSFLEAVDRRGVINLGRVVPNFYATITALEQASVLDVQSTPKLSTINGNEATLVIGNSVYYLVETQNVTGGVNPIITTTPRYEKVEANLDLKIKPFVSYNEDITLNIAFESSDFIDPTIDGAPPGNSTRKFDSKIRIKNEEMIVIGGLENESTSETTSGLPVLSRIPVLKWIFGRNTKTTSRNKLLVFIKPTVVY